LRAASAAATRLQRRDLIVFDLAAALAAARDFDRIS
jgi:hypothetical protein